jgi:hypothetical protein
VRRAGGLDDPVWAELKGLVVEIHEQADAFPEEHGDQVDLNSSRRPAFRYCRAMLAPPQIPTSLSPAATLALLERGLEAVGHEG